MSASAATYPPAYPATYVTSTWSDLVQPVNGAPNLYDVACPSATICYAVGQAGTIETGSLTSTWTKIPSGTALDLFSIACPTSTSCLAVGGMAGSGVIVGKKGSGGWHQLFTINQQLLGIGCSSTSICVAVGDNGTVLRSTNGGASWRKRTSGTLAPVDAVYCPPGTAHCLAVGSRGNYLLSNDAGASWSSKSSGITVDLGSVWCSPAMICVVGSGRGIWLYTNQLQTWLQVQDSAGYRGMCLNTGTCALAAAGGVLTTTNGGRTWVTQLTGLSGSLLAVACRGTTNCYAVGESGRVAHSSTAFAVSSPPVISTSQFPSPNPNAAVQAVVSGPDGAMWATEFRGNAILRITVAGASQEFPLVTPGSEPEAITSGPDGALWFTESGTGSIGRITTAGAVSEYAIPGYSCSTCNLPSIVSGPDGALWFTELQANHLGRITTSGVITEYALPPAMTPEHIVSGPDGNLWFAGYEDTINRMTTAGVLTTFKETSGGGLVGIALGPDGNLWFTATVGSWIGVISTAGVLHAQYSVHPSIQGITTITKGPDGAMWFADVQTLDRITMSGVLTEYPAVGESWVTQGPGGTTLWYATFGNSVGEVTIT